MKGQTKMWFKVDDGFHSSRKLLAIPKRARFAAAGLWSIAGSWAGDQLTDGHVPDFMIQVWGASPTAPAALVECGLWEREPGGYVFCKWHEYQPSKQDVDAERATSRERMRDLRARRKQDASQTSGKRRANVGPTSGERPEDVSKTSNERFEEEPRNNGGEGEAFGRTVTNGSENVSNPDPTRPDPVSKDTDIEAPQAAPKKKKRGHRLPEGWMPGGDLVQTMNAECPQIDQQAEHRKFCDYWTAQAGARGVKLDWNATYRNWIRNAAERAPKTGNRSTDRMMTGYQAMAGYQGPPIDPWGGKELTR